MAPSARPPTREDWRKFLSTIDGNNSCEAEDYFDQLLLHVDSCEPLEYGTLSYLEEEVCRMCDALKRGRASAPWSLLNEILKILTADTRRRFSGLWALERWPRWKRHSNRTHQSSQWLMGG